MTFLGCVGSWVLDQVRERWLLGNPKLWSLKCRGHGTGRTSCGIRRLTAAGISKRQPQRTRCRANQRQHRPVRHVRRDNAAPDRRERHPGAHSAALCRSLAAADEALHARRRAAAETQSTHARHDERSALKTRTQRNVSGSVTRLPSTKTMPSFAPRNTSSSADATALVGGTVALFSVRSPRSNASSAFCSGRTPGSVAIGMAAG